MSLIAGFRNAGENSLLPCAFTLPHAFMEGEQIQAGSFTFLLKKGEKNLFKSGRKILILEGFLTGEIREKDLLSRYEKDGWEKMLPLLEGSFSLVLWDGEKETLFLARDPLGTKSLYYFSRGEDFAFAGALPLLKYHRSFPEEYDLQNLWDYLSFGFIPGTGTQYKGVKKVAPGSFLQVTFAKNGQAPLLCRKRYWKGDLFRKTDLNYKETCDLCREKLSSATSTLMEKARNITGKEPLLFLSGGLDSAIISSLALENTRDTLKGYSISFTDPLYDEGPLAAESADFLNMRYNGRFSHKIVKVRGEDLLPDLEKLLTFTGLPYADSSLLPTSLLASCAANEGERFALNGDGADELFGGYERYIAMELYRKLEIFPLFLRKNLSSLFSSLPGSRGGDRGKLPRLVRFLEGAALAAPIERYFRLMSHADEELKKSCAGELFAEMDTSFTSFDPEFLLEERGEKGEGAMKHDLAFYLASDTLPKAEFAADSASIISTSPFLAKGVMEFAFSLPFSSKIKGFQRKKILCDTFREKIVPGLPKRKKRGFGVPVGAFFRSSWKEYLKGHLLEGCLVKDGLFRKEALEKLLLEHENGEDHSYFLFYLLTLALVLQKK